VAELALKSKLGKREFNTAVIEEWKQARIEPATFDDASALNFANLSSEWLPDPFDRQIVSIAMSNQFELITADRRILELGYDWIVDATA
jgi:PIN domain nuclease of toxin-antitoxin system